MKIRISLRLYFFASIVLVSSLMAIGFSLLSANYFIDGLDKGLKGIMLELSKTTEVEDGQPKTIVGFNVASRWEDLPEIIQSRFDPSIEVGVLYKEEDKASMFTLPENLFFVLNYPSPEGEPRYISRIMLEENRPKIEDNIQPATQMLRIAITGLAAIALFSFFLIMLMRKIAKPIESLRNWAKSLNHSNLQKTPPDFTYNELNTLATIIRSSLVSAHDSLTREQQFLSYASHELRTPISVVRSNVELLSRLNEKTPLTEKQQLTVQRIERAVLTMSDLTNTLLWLSRRDEQQIESEPVNLSEEINTLCGELDYLLSGKKVKLLINTDDENSIINTEATSCHIVLTNLIRNAYQHTQGGVVHITQHGSRVTVMNSNNTYSTEHITMGYGLGLQLSEKIIKRHGWVYNIYDTPERYEVVVDFGEAL
jgi:signal transduction histidine kinase